MDITKMPKLGFGLMRLPLKEGSIDFDKVCNMVDTYLAHGYNYFDTAYIYHGGDSERIVKDAIVKRHSRESFTLATKLPAWVLNSKEDRDKVFNDQLTKMGVDYIDYYLLHSLEDGNNYDTYEKLDCFNWAIDKKKQGLIKHFGFSFHGTPELLIKVLNEHPEVEFVQIQLNYADWDNKVVHSGKLYKILLERNIPMIIMEPVKGGTLSNMAPDLEAMYKAYNPDSSIASWAMRFVGSLPGIATILSGMTEPEQLNDNLKTFDDFKPLSDEEKSIIDKVVKKMLDTPLIPCTACRYCVDGCPKNIHIPDIFNAVNTKRKFPDDARPGFFYVSLTGFSGKACDCVGCGQCAKVCPQHLEIPSLLKEASEIFDK